MLFFTLYPRDGKPGGSEHVSDAGVPVTAIPHNSADVLHQDHRIVNVFGQGLVLG
jgi:hypothetical protein